MAQFLEVSRWVYFRSGDAQTHLALPKEQRRAILEVRTVAVHHLSCDIFGAPRITLDLIGTQWRAGGQEHLAQRITDLGIAGVSPRAFKVTSVSRPHDLYPEASFQLHLEVNEPEML